MKNTFKIATLLIILIIFSACAPPTQVPNEYVGNWYGTCAWAMPDQNGNPVFVGSENTHLQINTDYSFTGSIGNMNISGIINPNSGSVGGSGIEGESNFSGFSVVSQCTVNGRIAAVIYKESNKLRIDGSIKIISSTPNNFPYTSGELYLSKQ